jgi:hypothetical protein
VHKWKSRDSQQLCLTKLFPEKSTRRIVDPNVSFDATPAWSPDSTQIAFDFGLGGGPGELAVVNADGGSVKRYARTHDGDYHPTWSADGSEIALMSWPAKGEALGVVDVSAHGPPRLIVRGAISWPAWQPTPAPTPPAPPPPAAYHIQACWVQYTGNSSSTVDQRAAASSLSASDLLTRGVDNFWSILELNPTPASDVAGVRVTLIEPNGTVFATLDPSNWPAHGALGHVTLLWRWNSDSSMFFQHPERSGTGAWTFHWALPDGEICDSTVNIS